MPTALAMSRDPYREGPSFRKALQHAVFAVPAVQGVEYDVNIFSLSVSTSRSGTSSIVSTA